MQLHQSRESERSSKSSPNPIKPTIPVGIIVGTHGLRGLLKIKPLTDFLERLQPGETLLLEGKELEVVQFKIHKAQIQIEFKEFNNRTAAEELRGKILHGYDTEIVLDEDEYRVADLIGMTVICDDGRVLGKVSEIIPAPAQDLIQVNDVLIPMVKEFVTKIDMNMKSITVHLIEGMEDLTS